nr:immunoglobulin heavy chain junction region [Macaca mulatta]MOX91624.1 immunoglobulin heavy chain junction region [Macaca mulatta]MOX91672.1 immunoglobulin heavy chain junction region [Macaca mulatta]MOX91695.1 immunoglobulin heavy chain junction region [Macaca mulatta]MOX92570.1 immunoglobulin heavy chain junction region [Macaca mulatta]
CARDALGSGFDYW